MCGIFITNDPGVTDKSFNLIESTLRFRGPDCSSELVSVGDWKAYHSRLSIIDVDAGVNQPIVDSMGGVLVFNGEILNYRELGLKYFKKQYSSDSILLSDLINSKCLDLDELDGFYAFVYVNGIGELEYCVRDRFGVKPLFYCENGSFISISSEPATLKKLYGLGINENAIAEYRAVRAPIFSGSFFDGVSSVSPGTCLVNGTYFEASHYLNGEYRDVTDLELKAALQKGVSSRMVADVPVGLLLSRGIDSNLISTLGKFDRYYSIGFSGDGDLEYLKSQNIPDLTLMTSSAETYSGLFNEMLELRQEPMSVPNEVLLAQISKEASKDGIKVLLSGEGADEFFGGYDRIFQWAYRAKTFDLGEFLSLYCYQEPAVGSRVYEQFKLLFDEIQLPSVFEMVRWFFVRFHMPVLFRRLDFSLMYSGVEGREPLANMHTFKLASKMSPEVLMGSELGKMPLRRIISETMGETFAYEKKIGFPVDMRTVFGDCDGRSSYEIWFSKNLEVLK